MATLADRKLELATMLGQIAQVVQRGDRRDPPAFTLILGAGASFGVVPSARQMLGIPDHDGYHPACIPAFLHEREYGARPSELPECVRSFWKRVLSRNAGPCTLKVDGEGLPDAEVIP